jgi:hypothetical protein
MFEKFTLIVFMKKEGIPSSKRVMNLTFKRRLSKSLENRAAVISIPRSIAQAWEKYPSIVLVFDGDCLVIKPTIGDGA